MSDVDDILFAPVVKEKAAQGNVNWYLKGEKVPEVLLKFDDPRVIVRFGVDAELSINQNTFVAWLYPLNYLAENECVVEIIYPERRLFRNTNSVIIAIDPHPSKQVPNHVYPPNIDAVKEVWP